MGLGLNMRTTKHFTRHVLEQYFLHEQTTYSTNRSPQMQHWKNHILNKLHIKGFISSKKILKLEGFSQNFSKFVKFTLEKHMFSKSLPILRLKKSFIVKLFQECCVFLYAISMYYYDIEINTNILMLSLRRNWQQRISIVINMVARDIGLEEGRIIISKMLVPLMSKTWNNQ
jgi:hypothetical protein